MKLSGRLGLGFGIMLVLVLLVGGLALWQMNVLSELNHKLYHHPFTVKSAVLSIDADIIRMHRAMKDLVLARDQEDADSAWALVRKLDQSVLGQFAVIRERFLGNPDMYRRAEELFRDWRPIRREVAELVRQGRKEEAADITRQRGAAHVLQIVAAMNDLKVFAESKAAEFYAGSHKARDWAFTVMYVIIAVTLLTGVILAVGIARSITRPAREIAEVSQAIAGGDLTRRITYQSHDEIGQMAQSLREMLAGVIGEGQSIKNGLVGPVWTTNRGLTITYLNREAADLIRVFCGLEAEQVVGRKRVKEVFRDAHQDWATLAETTLAEAAKAEADISFHAGEKEAVYHAYTAPLRDLDGGLMGVMGVGTDMTWRQQAEREKALLEAQLRQSQKMESIGTLAGGVAHDFNNILSAILGYTELALEDLPQDHSLRPNLEKIFTSGWRAQKLVAQLLAFSRKQMLKLNTFSLNDVVTKSQDMLEHIIGEDVDLQTALNPRAGTVRADFHQMEQVLMNLVANAREALPTGGKITLETDNVVLDQEYADSHLDARPGPHVMLAVSDNGCGMDQATRQRIFDPFFTTKETGKGTGLGLAMVYGIVKQLGGNIYVYSEPGSGSVFKVYLPRTESAAHDREIAAPPAASVSGDETILVVEDDHVVREFICAALTRLGYQVLEAADSDQALELTASRPSRVDMLITDVIMPGMSGRELAQRLVSDQPGLKVLYISGYTANVIVHHGVLDQGISFLQKPVSLADLSRKVREVLEQ